MELKDVILSTLAEMEEVPSKGVQERLNEEQIDKTTTENTSSNSSINEEGNSLESELFYLNSIRERLLVLFEGFQAPNNSNIEAKVDMTLNFLEYTLATIDARVEKLEKGNP